MQKSSKQKGGWGEDLAAEYLLNKSYKILFRNWKAERGDIDIIALDGNYIVFVEVKTGFSTLYGPPELRITQSKKRQLYKLASIFVAEAHKYKLDDHDYRFDVVVVDGNQKNFEIRHYENAFGL
jgi:putative endonuclease